MCSRIMQQEELMERHPNRLTATRILVTEKWGKSKENYTSSYEHLSILNNKQIFTVSL